MKPRGQIFHLKFYTLFLSLLKNVYQRQNSMSAILVWVVAHISSSGLQDESDGRFITTKMPHAISNNFSSHCAGP